MDSSNCGLCGTANFRDCKHRPATAPVPANLRASDEPKVDQRKQASNYPSPGLAFHPEKRRKLFDAYQALAK